LIIKDIAIPIKNSFTMMAGKAALPAGVSGKGQIDG
jgi:hypothetical protein